MNEQYARYEVPIWEAGWAKAELAAAGVPIVTTARQGNIIVIVIPAQFAEFNHHTATATHRQRARGPVPKWAVLGVAIGAPLFLLLWFFGATVLWLLAFGGLGYLVWRYHEPLAQAVLQAKGWFNRER